MFGSLGLRAIRSFSVFKTLRLYFGIAEALFGIAEALFGIAEALFGNAEALFGNAEALFGNAEALSVAWFGGRRQVPS